MAHARALNQLICRVLIGVVLFAQLAVAGYACPGLAPTSAPAIDAQADQTSAMPGGCEQMDRKAVNLCAEHCKFGQQSSHAAPLPVMDMPAPAMLYLLPVDGQATGMTRPLPPPDPLLAAAPPPHALLHCVLRI